MVLLGIQRNFTSLIFLHFYFDCKFFCRLVVVSKEEEHALQHNTVLTSFPVITRRAVESSILMRVIKSIEPYYHQSTACTVRLSCSAKKYTGTEKL